MKRPNRVVSYKNRQPIILCILQQAYTRISEVGLRVLGVLGAGLRLAIFPLQLLVKAVSIFDTLAQAVVRSVIRLCFALLAATMIAAVSFALLRTLLHPWFI